MEKQNLFGIALLTSALYTGCVTKDKILRGPDNEPVRLQYITDSNCRKYIDTNNNEQFDKGIDTTIVTGVRCHDHYE